MKPIHFLLLFTLFLLSTGVHAAWVDAPAGPPGYQSSGCAPFPCAEADFKPVNLSATTQTKAGDLGAARFCLPGAAGCISDWATGAGTNHWTLTGSDIYSNNAGNVGIGTANPGAKLTVTQTAGKPGAAGDAVYAYANSTNAAVSAEQADAAGYAIYASGGRNYFGGSGGSGNKVFDVVGDNATPSDAAALVNFSGNRVGASILSVNQAGLGPAALFFGNVGIGTTNPGAKLEVAGDMNVTGGSGTSYITAPIEIATTQTPRISFHWPGVVASQLGMDSGGTIRTYDNPGTGYQNFAANAITAKGRLDVGEANDAYSYITMRDDESPNGVKYIHANSNLIGFLSGAGSWLSRWDDSGNMINTGSISATSITASGNINIPSLNCGKLFTNASGVISCGSVSWGEVSGIPGGFADGVDNDTDTNTTYSAGSNLSLNGTQFNVVASPTFSSVVDNGNLTVGGQLYGPAGTRAMMFGGYYTISGGSCGQANPITFACSCLTPQFTDAAISIWDSRTVLHLCWR